MSRKIIIKSISTIVLFFSINFGLWEVFVANGMSEAYASFSVYGVLVLIVIGIWQKKLQMEWQRFKQEVRSFKKFFIELVCLLIVGVVLANLFQYFINGSLNTDNTENVRSMVDTIHPILSVFMISAFAPIIEELTFRESIIGFVKKENKMLIMVMVLISIVIFDCIHLYRWQEFFYYLPLSVVLTVFYIRNNRNVYASMIMHACANLPGIILMILGLM